MIKELEPAWPHVAHVPAGDPQLRHGPGNDGISNAFFLDLPEKKGWDHRIGCGCRPAGHTLDTLRRAERFGMRGRA